MGNLKNIFVLFFSEDKVSVYLKPDNKLKSSPTTCKGASYPLNLKIAQLQRITMVDLPFIDKSALVLRS
jgi:hypothetical protein